MNIRKITVIHETVCSQGGGAAAVPISRVAGIGLIENPLAGRQVEDLRSELLQAGYDLGEQLMAKMLACLPTPTVSYGKARAVV